MSFTIWRFLLARASGVLWLYKGKDLLSQGHLQKWTEHLRVFFLNLKPLEITSPKFQYLYNYKRNEFSPNLEGVAQKIGLPCPFEILNIFGRKSILLAPRAVIFGEKQVSIEMYKLWNFGVDISNHFSAIQDWPISFSNSPLVGIVNLEIIPTRGGIGKWNQSILNCRKVVRDINTKISQLVHLSKNMLFTRYDGSRCQQNGFPAKNV